MPLAVHEVGVDLLAKTNLRQMMPELIRDFETLNKLATETRESFATIGQTLRGLSGASRSLGSIRKALEGFNKEGASGALASVKEMSQAMSGMRGIQEGMAKEAREMSASWRTAAESMRSAQRVTQRSGGGGRSGGSSASSEPPARPGYMSRVRTSVHENGMDAAMAAQIGGGELTGMVERMLHSAMEPAYFRSLLRADNRVSEDNAQGAYDAAIAATKSAPGTSLSKNMEAVLDLKNVLGSLDEATKALPEFARLSSTLSVVSRNQGGSGDPAFAAAKALEIMGGMTEDYRDPKTGKIEERLNPALLHDRVQKMARVSVATAGRVGPEDYLGFAKQARVGGMQLSDEFVYEKLPAMLMAMGGQRAGTAIQSISQVFQGGHVTNKSLDAMRELGLAGTAHVVGKGAKAHIVGEVFEQSLLATDPAAWATKVHDHLRNDLHMTEEQALTAVQKMSQRNTIAGFLADLMKDAAAIAKEQLNIQHTTPEAIANMQENNPEARMQRFHASLENFMAALAGPALEPALKLLDNATAGLNRLGEWARANPGMATTMTEVAIGLGVVATAVGTLGMAIAIYGPAFKMAGSLLGGGAPPAPAAAAGGSLLGSIAGGAVRLATGLAGLAAGVGIGVFWPNNGIQDGATESDIVRKFNAGPGYSAMPPGGAAPPPSALPGGAPSGPVPVVVTNGRDLTRSVAADQARQANRPPSGPLGDPRMTSWYPGSGQ